MTEPEQPVVDTAAVLEQVERRRVRAEELLADAPPAETPIERVKRVEAERRRKAAERAGQLDVSGDR